MSSPGFKRWGASAGASGASSYAYSKSDGTQYVSPSEEAKSKKGQSKPAKKPEKPKTAGPKPGKAALAYSSPTSSPKPSKPSPSATRSAPEVVSGGLASTTYEKQPDWAFAERSKNATGQYRDGMFQDSTNPNNSSTVSKPSYSTTTTTTVTTTVTTTKPKVTASSSTTPSWAQKPVQSTFTKSTTTTATTSKPAVASYQVGGSGNAQAAYGSGTGTSSSGGVVKSGLASTTYEKQPDWAYSERHKNTNGQYKDGMFQGGGAKVQYGSASASPTQLRAGGHLR